jgi:hypothetical protein
MAASSPSSALEGGGQREDRRLHRLAADGGEGKQAKRQPRPRRARLRGDLTLESPAVALHPEGHRGQQDHRDQKRNGLEDRREGRVFIFVDGRVDRDPAAERRQNRQRRARPHRAHLRRLPHLAKGRQQHANHQCGFQAFAQE